jgi:Ni,Fe-hydrogenase maturation factor
MIRAKTVIFVSSYFLFEKMKPEIIIKHFLSDHKENEATIDHSDPPFSLLSFTESIYHEKPNAFWILIPAINHQEGETFSSSTEAAIKEAINYLGGQQLIESLEATG